MRWISAVFFVWIGMNVHAQTVQSNFSMPAQACLDQHIKIGNQSANAVNYEWDFCSGDLNLIPSASVLSNSYNGYGSNVYLIEQDGNIFGFFIGRAAGKLYRLDFGTDVNSQPTLVDLGNFGMGLANWRAIDIVKEDNQYYAFVIDSNLNSVYRFTFGTSLANMPSSLELLYSGDPLSSPTDIKSVADGALRMLFIANLGNEKLTRLTFDQSFRESSVTVDYFSVNGAVLLSGIAFIKDGSKWLGLATSGAASQVYKIEFTDGLDDNTPIITNFSVPSPVGLAAVSDNNQFYVFIQSQNSNNSIFRWDFGSTMSNAMISQDINAIGITGAYLWAFSMFKIKSQWTAFGTELTGSTIFRVRFPNNCPSTIESSTEPEPTISVNTAGSFNVALKVSDSNGNTSQSVKSLLVVSDHAPDLAILSQNLCTNHDVNFTSVNLSGGIITREWSFGDTETSADIQPSHQYTTAGLYAVSLQVTAANGCDNYTEQAIKIYDPPLVSFDLSGALICTNNDLLFVNNTPDSFDGNLTYAWYVEGDFVSDLRDLPYNFTTVGNHAIKLITSIPGCSSESVQITSQVKAGPSIDFSSVGVCEQESVKFTSIIGEAIDSQTWDFKDGDSSTDINPDHVFTTDGTYAIALTALSPNGCQNTKTKTITINDRPMPDFAIEGPPSSCSGNSSNFSDLTPAINNGQLESWQWNFKDGGSAVEQNPSHMFLNAGNYDVEFTVTTDKGCTNSIVKPITILQSPNLNFSNTASCLNKPTSLNATSNTGLQYYWEIGTAYYETQTVNHTFAKTGSHPVKVTVVGPNQCETALTKNIVIPEPVTPAFNFTNNCKGTPTNFTSPSTSTDPIASRLWNFAGEGTSVETNPSFTFSNTGSKSVSLQITTQSGCTYQSQKTVSVIEPPLAKFSFTPDFGVPPQEISFVNESTNATSFSWKFGDGGESATPSPRHTFTALGDYSVELKSSNSAGCFSTTSRSVSMVAPLPDVDLNLMTVTPNADGSLKVIITIANNGNTVLRNLPVQLDLSSQITLETIVSDLILPFSQYNLVLNYSIAQRNDLAFLCASATLEGDLHPEGNRVCNQLKTDVAIVIPYPNPVKEYLAVEWVAAGAEQIEIQFLDDQGKSVINTTETSAAGLNQKFVDVRNMRAGIYVLRIIGPNTSQSFRILVSQ